MNTKIVLLIVIAILTIIVGSAMADYPGLGELDCSRYTPNPTVKAAYPGIYDPCLEIQGEPEIEATALPARLLIEKPKGRR